MIKRDIIIYLTGFFDGEGHVSLLKKNHHKYIKKTNKMKIYTYTELSLRLSNTDKNVLNYIQKYFGGYIYPMKKYQPHHKDTWVWQIAGKNATEISKLMYPFSIIKKEKLKTAKEFYDSVS